MWCFTLLLVALWLVTISFAGRAAPEVMLRAMTLEDKIGQMLQMDVGFFLKDNAQQGNVSFIDYAKLRSALNTHRCGSMFNNQLRPSEWLEFLTVIQKIAITESPARIPLLYGIDSMHGANYVIGSTSFPHHIGSAGSFNPDLIQREAAITAKDTRAVGIPWVFSPLLEISHHPLWPRMYELFGEDPYLTSVMTRAMFDGMSGPSNMLLNNSKVATCMKHFVGYSDVHSGKDHTTSLTPDRVLREILLPSFAAGAEAGIQTVMASMGSINGIPVTSSPKYLKNLLSEIKFSDFGIVVSDYQAIQQLVNKYYVAEDLQRALELALNAGIDMIMWGTDDPAPYTSAMLNLVRSGKISESRLDQSVSKILLLKQQLGLLDNPLPDPNNPNIKTIGSVSDRKSALELAHESITLLKNDVFILPLSTQTSRKILLTGPAGNSIADLNGGWSIHWQGAKDSEFPFGTTIYQGIQNILGGQSQATVKYIRGCNTYTQDPSFNDAVAAAAQSDVVIVACGEAPYAEIFGDIDDLTLPQVQLDLISALQATGTPVVLVLVEGRPRTVWSVVDNIHAIIDAHLPGSEGGQAIADILFGIVNPSGRLSFSYPRSVNDLVPYWRSVSDLTLPQWPFGYGLSYSSFLYLDLKLSSQSITLNDVLTASVTVYNSGPFDGKEVVQLYIRDEVASVSPPPKRLRNFSKIAMKTGTSMQVSFKIIPQRDLAFVGLDDRWVIEPGKFTVMIGGSSADSALLRASFTLR